METRFPISKDRAHVVMSFTWYDAFRASKRAEQYSIHFEKAAVMFNLGAVLTQQALACDRTQDQGMKDAAKKFQVLLQALSIACELRFVLVLCLTIQRLAAQQQCHIRFSVLDVCVKLDSRVCLGACWVKASCVWGLP